MKQLSEQEARELPEGFTRPWVEIDGRVYSPRTCCKITGVNYGTAMDRIIRGWGITPALLAQPWQTEQEILREMEESGVRYKTYCFQTGEEIMNGYGEKCISNERFHEAPPAAAQTQAADTESATSDRGLPITSLNHMVPVDQAWMPEADKLHEYYTTEELEAAVAVAEAAELRAANSGLRPSASSRTP